MTEGQVSDGGAPDFREVRCSLGNTLGQILTDYGSNVTRELLSLAPSSKIARQLPAGKATSKESERLKAEAHHYILGTAKRLTTELGQDQVKKFEEDIVERERKGREAALQEELCLYEAKHRAEIKLLKEELRTGYEDYIQKLQHEAEERLRIEGAAAATSCDKKIRTAVAREHLTVTREMLRKMRLEVSHIVKSLYDEFEQSFRVKRLDMISDFNGIMRRERLKLKTTLEEFEAKKAKDLHVQRRELEMEYVSSMMTILCVEKSRNSTERDAMRKHLEKEIAELRTANGQTEEALAKMKEEMCESERKRMLLEEELANLFREFKKFVNFAFCSAPGQKDFLLPLEKHKQHVPMNTKCA